MESNPYIAPRVVVAYDATKDRNEHEFKHTINGIRLRGDIIQGGNTLMVIGVLHRVLHPCKLFDELPSEEGFSFCMGPFDKKVGK